MTLGGLSNTQTRKGTSAASSHQPCGIADVSLPPGHILCVARIHEDHIEATPLEDLEGRDPIDPGGFHGHAGDALGFEPVRQVMQILRARAKRAHRRVTGIGIDRRHVHGRSDVDSCRPRLDHREFRVVAGRQLCHAKSSV